MKLLPILLFIISCASVNKPFASIPPIHEPIEEGRAVIWVHGEVDKPGRYVVKEGITAVQMISLAGGLKDDAKSTIILRRYARDGQGAFQIIDTSISLPCYNGGNEDAVCMHGDEILVDRYGKAWLAILGGWLSAMVRIVD